MTNRHPSTIHATASLLIETLAAGQTVTLDVTASDAASGALLDLISEIHAAATAHHVGITMTPLGEGGLQLTLAVP